jgi:hypothetical protein
MVWTQEDFDNYKAIRVNRDGYAGKVDDFVNSAHSQSSYQQYLLASPGASSPVTRSSPYRPSSSIVGPGEEPLRSPEWMGMGRPCGKKRTWKIKSITTVVAPNVPDITQD